MNRASAARRKRRFQVNLAKCMVEAHSIKKQKCHTKGDNANTEVEVEKLLENTEHVKQKCDISSTEVDFPNTEAEGEMNNELSEHDSDSIHDYEIESDDNVFGAISAEDTSTESESDDDSSISDFESDIESENKLDSVSHSTQMLFDGSSVTSHECSLALLSLMDKHRLTYSAVNDTLKMFSCVLPSPSYLQQSERSLIKKFIDYDKLTTVHRCCGFCTNLLPSGSDCTRNECQVAPVRAATFVEVSLECQLKTLFSDPSFFKLLQHRFKPSGVSDIYSGSVYQERSLFLGSPYNISFTLNYDGAPKFKSSNMQIWPLQLCINELPPILRKSRKYQLLAGLWCSTRKPPSFSFLSPLLETLTHIENEGVTVDIPSHGKQIVKGQLICAVLDLPAKAMVMNCNQYNGVYGCGTCEHKGEMVKVGKGRARVYPVKAANLRTHQQQLKYADAALKKREVIVGVKGHSPLVQIRSFDLVKCIPVDYMHCILLGVGKKLAKLWFDSSFSKQEWYIGRKTAEVDKRLLGIKLPDIFSRNSRSISERKFWKASEWKSFIIFYVPAVLFSILPNKYYFHCFLLIKSLRILLAPNIVEEQLQLAERLLKKFCNLMEKYYGVAHCGINIHNLLHLTYYVRCFGPLWTHSAFAFESQMNNFLQHSHATHGIENQIITFHLLNQKLQTERSKVLKSSLCHPNVKVLLQRFESGLQTDSHEQQFIGAGVLEELDSKKKDDINSFLQSYQLATTSDYMRVFTKAKVKNGIFFSRQQKRVTKRNSYTITYTAWGSTDIQYAIIEKFFTLDGHHMAVITKLNTNPLFQSHKQTSDIQDLPLLYEDYLSYTEGVQTFIFVSQICHKCCNLSNCLWNVLTFNVNDIEIE